MSENLESTEQKEVLEVQVPLAIKQLIDKHYETVEKSLNELQNANVEMMRILNILPQDGWRLDIQTYKYIKQTVK
jgi:hypothetical protein